jgi:signal transduction histidine kinase
MISAPAPENEIQRLASLNKYETLDSDAEEKFDELTRIAASMFNTSIALVSFVDEDRQWFKSKVGLDACETSRDIAFCSHAILQSDVFVVEDTLKDERFADNPLVTGGPNIRFYAGAPLVNKEGYALGTLCVIDQQPKTFSEQQKSMLATLANQVVSQLELQLSNKSLLKSNLLKEKILAILAHDLTNNFSGILGLSRLMSKPNNTWKPEKLIEFAGKIHQSSEQAHQLLKDILEWSKNQIEDHSDYQNAAELTDVFAKVKILTEAQARNKNIELLIEQQADISLPTSLSFSTSAILNLVSNAIKFSQPGQTVSLWSKEDNEAFYIGVTDSGVGMPQEQADLLFSAEVSASSSGTTGEVGSGLGSIFIYDFVLAVNGQITVTSQPDQGCEVVIKILKNN